MRAILLAALAAVPLIAPAAADDMAKPVVSNPWARATPGGVTNGAAYVTITAPPTAGDTLLSVQTPLADHAELHEHIHEDGIMKMRRVEKIELKPGATVTFEPMGYHLMLIGLKGLLKAGDTVHLSLSFQSAGTIEVDAPVIAIGASPPAGGAVPQLEPAPAHDHSHMQ